MFRVPPAPFSLKKPPASISKKSASQARHRRLSSNSTERPNKRNLKKQSTVAAEPVERVLEAEGEEESSLFQETRLFDENEGQDNSALARRTKKAAQQQGSLSPDQVDEDVTVSQH